MRRTTGVAARYQPGVQLLLRQLYIGGERLVTRVDAASDPNRVGSDQVRGVRFEGERMILIPPTRRTGGSEEFREISWERIAPE
jgi:Lipocalin-like domain